MSCWVCVKNQPKRKHQPDWIQVQNTRDAPEHKDCPKGKIWAFLDGIPQGMYELLCPGCHCHLPALLQCKVRSYKGGPTTERAVIWGCVES